MKNPSPRILNVDTQRIEAVLERAAESMNEDDSELLRQIVESHSYLLELVGDKNTTIARLRKLIFGSRSEKSKDILEDIQRADVSPEEGSSSDAQAGTGASSSGCSVSEPGEAKPGHGRHGADAYAGAHQVDVPHASLAAGDTCPDCGQGTLYEKKPGVLVRFVGQAPVQATVYRLQKLRCHLCGKVFKASPPAGAGDVKHDPTAASMIGLLKYGSGLPFNRLQRLQGNCEIPLAASTQWGIVRDAAASIAPAYQELIRQAAQGDILYNDDTTVKILELMGNRAKQRDPAFDEHDPERTGLFTSGVVSTREGNRIALFFSGRRHAGENLAEVLKHRAAELSAPIHMCDGLSRNLPSAFETILANCLAHGRRYFVELHDRFPEECRYVIEAFKLVYENDQRARDEGMSPEERLAYHQSHSRSTMDNLHAWLQRQFDERLVEPNSGLGEAINYLLKRWDSLTLFLRQSGAPLDNNVCERALKKAILFRKNSLFYKTQNGARVGDIYMSMIYTCETCGVNAFDYLTELQRHAVDVSCQPEQWMPWNYRDTLAATIAAA
jgi:hypothetical protein